MIDFIEKNELLKELYPQGFKTLAINSFWTDFISFNMRIRTQDHPAVFLEEYGAWSLDYDMVEFKLTGNSISFLEIDSWDYTYGTSEVEPCAYEINKNNSGITLKFWNSDNKWSIEMTVSQLIFNSVEVYMKEEHDYVVL